MKKKLSKIEKYGLIGIGIAMSLYLYFSRVYDPTTREYTNSREALAVLSQEVGGMRITPDTTEIQNKINALNQELEEVTADVDKILLTEKAQSMDLITDVIVEMNVLMTRNNLIVDTVFFEELSKEKEDYQPEEEYVSRSCGMIFIGDFKNIISFINDLSTMHYLVDIEEVSIEYDDEEGRYYVTMMVAI